MSKGYVVANIRVRDQEKFKQFSGMAGPAIKRYGGNSEMIEATVMKYDAGRVSVYSIADKFSRAESLIRRRIKDTAIDTLLDL